MRRGWRWMDDDWIEEECTLEKCPSCGHWVVHGEGVVVSRPHLAFLFDFIEGCYRDNPNLWLSGTKDKEIKELNEISEIYGNKRRY
jgi:hypothetical protein